MEIALIDVGFGGKADIAQASRNARFRLKADILRDQWLIVPCASYIYTDCRQH